MLIVVFTLMVLYKKYHTFKFLYYTSIITVLFIFLINTNTFSVYMDNTINYLNDNGISTRVLTMFQDGEISDDNGRNKIKEVIGKSILEKPAIGYGLYGDRAVTKGNLPNYPEGIYAHSIIYELLCDFGIIFGTLILLFIIIKILLLYKRCNFYNCLIILMIIAMGFFQLLLSNSFVQSKYFLH